MSLKTFTYGLIGLLVLATVAVEAHRRGGTTRERARFGLLKDDVEMFTDALATSLRLPEACRTIFADVRVAPGSASAVALAYAHDPEREDLLRAGAEPWAGTHLERLDLTVADEPDRRTRVRGAEFRHFRARLDLEFAVRERFERGIPVSLEILLWLNSKNEIAACYGPRSVGALCDMTGGFYDVSARPDRRCRPSLHAALVGRDQVYPRGHCRVTGLGLKCPGGAKATLVTQESVGFGSERQIVCRTCD